jgi:hypothetical protein
MHGFVTHRTMREALRQYLVQTVLAKARTKTATSRDKNGANRR